MDEELDVAIMLELRELPKGWQMAPIEECLATINGKKKVGQGWSPQCEKEASPSNEQWGVLKTTAIQAGVFLQEENKLLPTNLEPRPQNEVQRGDLLTTCAGPRSRCGVTCLVRETRPRLMISGKMYRYRAKEGFIDAEYLEAYLQTQVAWDAIDKMKTGGSDSGLNLTHERFLQLPIPVAPLPEQRRIMSAIKTQLGRLDAAVARLHAAKAKLKRYKQAVLKSAFTENNWPVTSIGDVYEVYVGSTPSRAKPALWNGNVPWVSSGEVAFCELYDTREKITHDALKNSEKRIHPSGTVMLAMIGEGKTRGQAAILRIAAAHNQNTAALRMPDSLHSPEYLYFFFLYEYENTRRVGSGNNQMALNKTRIQAIEIPMPDPATQVRVALEIADRLDQVEALETTIDAQLLQVTRLRQAVLKRAFEGRLVAVDTPVVQLPAALGVAAEPAVPYQRGAAHRALTIEERAAINAWVVHVSNKDHHLGRTKAEKIEHLIEAHIGYDHQRAPIRDAAGPIDLDSRKRVEEQMTKRKWGWIERKEVRGGKIMYHYHSGPHAADAVARAEVLLGDRLAEATRLVRAMKSLKTSRAEVVATLHAAWNDLLHDSKPATDRDIMIEATTEWHEDKMEVEHSEWVWGLGWLRQHGVIPTGNAKPVKAKTKK